jgi:adenosylmethionine-8-amino-7-oxononanoate aminotransferase
MTIAKGVTSGYMPLGGVICGPKVSEPFWSGDAGVFRQGYTYSGHAAACAVGLANLDIIEREGLIGRVAAMEGLFAQTLVQLESHPLVGEVRIVGLLGGIGLDPDALASSPGLADAIVDAARERGLLVRSLLGHSLQFSPPFVIEEREITLLAELLESAMGAVLESVAGSLAR